MRRSIGGKTIVKGLTGLCAGVLIVTSTTPVSLLAASSVDVTAVQKEAFNVLRSEALLETAEAVNTGVTEVPGTVSSVEMFNSTFHSATGYATVGEGVHDRSEYLNTEAHAKVADGPEFLRALKDAKDGKVKIIELTNDIDLGFKTLIEPFGDNGRANKLRPYGITEYKKPKTMTSMKDIKDNGSLTNPDMFTSGVSQLSMSGINGLTIFSQNGSSISHVETKINRDCSDIVIRNIRFKDMWMWDDDGNQKATGWSNLKLNGGKNLWIDHCTFDVAFDGNIDTENGSSNITISWCQIGQKADEALTKDTTSAIYKSITYMESLYQEGKLTTGVYKGFRDAGATPEEIMLYSAYHKKVHLSGSGDKDCIDYIDGNGVNYHDANNNIKLTFAYNQYYNEGQRVPMIRQGVGHLYNCVIDDSTHQEILSHPVFAANPGDYKLSRALNARNGASIAADTCVFNGSEEPITGAEVQGDDTNNMKENWPIYFKNAYNRSLIVNSKVTNKNGTYEGSSWDNNGENLFTKGFTWHDKSTIGNWAWSIAIDGAENYVKDKVLPIDEQGNPAPFAFTYGTDEKLPYEYKVMPLANVEEIVGTKSGAGAVTMTDTEWAKIAYTKTDKEAAEAVVAAPAVGTAKEVVQNVEVSAKAKVTDKAGNVVDTKTVSVQVEEAEEAKAAETKNVITAAARKNKDIKTLDEKAVVKVLDINLLDGRNNVAKLESGSLKVTVAKDALVDYNKVIITVYHVKEDGTVEVLPATVTENGVTFETTSLSPFVIAYSEKPEEKPTVDEAATKAEEKPTAGETATKAEEKPTADEAATKAEESKTVPTEAVKPQNTQDTGKNTQAQQNVIVTDTATEAAKTEENKETKAEEKNPQTGDTATPWFYALLGTVAALGAVVTACGKKLVFWKKR